MSKPSASKDVSLKGLDSFSRKFLFGGKETPKAEEYVTVTGRQAVSQEALVKYEKERMEDFVKRAGTFTEDLIAFISQQKKLRSLSDIETIFGLALACINLRTAYGSPQGREKALTEHQREKLLGEFDEVCYGAQQYFDAHK